MYYKCINDMLFVKNLLPIRIIFKNKSIKNAGKMVKKALGISNENEKL